MTPHRVFAAIRELLARGTIDRDRFELRIVGHVDLPRGGLDSLPVTFVDYVNHERAIAEMTGASALLFYQPPQLPGVVGKIYEYLGAGRPVLCVADPQNLAYRLVDELGAGVCADAGDLPAISRAIERLVGDWADGRETIDPGARRRGPTALLTPDADRRARRSPARGDLGALAARPNRRAAAREARTLV